MPFGPLSASSPAALRVRGCGPRPHPRPLRARPASPPPPGAAASRQSACAPCGRKGPLAPVAAAPALAPAVLSGPLAFASRPHQNAPMAVVTQPGIVTILAADGKLAGPVLLHIRRTAAFRRAYPSKGPTPAQRRAQNAFRYVDNRWKRMDASERDAWNAWKPWTGGWGYNRFQRVNIPRRLAGLPVLTEPPTLWP